MYGTIDLNEYPVKVDSIQALKDEDLQKLVKIVDRRTNDIVTKNQKSKENQDFYKELIYFKEHDIFDKVFKQRMKERKEANEDLTLIKKALDLEDDELTKESLRLQNWQKETVIKKCEEFPDFDEFIKTELLPVQQKYEKLGQGIVDIDIDKDDNKENHPIFDEHMDNHKPSRRRDRFDPTCEYCIDRRQERIDDLFNYLMKGQWALAERESHDQKRNERRAARAERREQKRLLKIQPDPQP